MKRNIPKKKSTMMKKQNYIVLFLLFATIGILLISLIIIQKAQQRYDTRVHAADSGWLSGASCHVADGSFAEWRGSPVTIAGTWNDRTADDHINQWSLGGEYRDWTESMDVSVGGFWGGSWANAANGGDDANWRAALSAIDANWGNKKTIFIRYAHEFNGSWYNWKVRPADNENYKAAFARFYTMVQTELVSKGRDAKVVWSPNSDEHNGVNTRDSWPGDQYVDVVGVDFYDWDVMKDQATWDANFNKSGKSGGPAGLGSWQEFARSHGKPIAFPEWGVSGDGPIDDPFFIQQMNNFFRANAGTGPGQVWYEIYFDCTGYDDGDGEAFLIYPEGDSQVPQSAAMYKSLKWGDVTTTNPTATQPVATTVPTNITPTMYCGGSSYCVPSGTVTPTTGDTLTPTIFEEITPTLEVIEELTPTEASTQPSPTSTQSNNGGNGGSKGVFQLFFAFILAILQFLLSLLGMSR